MKGTVVRNRYWVAGGAMLGTLATVVLAGMSSPGPRHVACEYGMYISGAGEGGQKRVSWYEPTGYVSNYTPFEFCVKMNIPASNTKVDEMVLTPVYETTVFNYLGAQGWELVSLPERDSRGTTTYFFKRAKPR